MTPAELKAHRQAKKMTQKEFAKWLDVSKDTVVSWENGRNRLPGWLVRRLNVDALTIQPLLDEDILLQVQRQAEEDGITAEEWVAKVIKAALCLAFFIGAAWAVLS